MGGVAADVTNIGRQLGRYLRPLEKWGGRGGGWEKKNTKQNIYAKEKVKKKNSCRKKVQLWLSLSFFQKVWSEINNE